MKMKFLRGSEKYGTSVMKENEVMLFAEVAMANGSRDANEIIADIKMIDTLLHAERLQKVCGPLTRKTMAGHYRRDSTFFHTMDRIVDGRLKGAFDD